MALYEIPLRRIDGTEANLGEYKGKVLLVVNVASKCGLTPQYEALEKVYQNYRDRGLVVVGFPANNFKEQEPGTNEEIQTFCQTTYNVDFPLFEKISVLGTDKHPLYQWLTSSQPKAISTSEASFRERLASKGIPVAPEPEILWNFEKFVVSRGGDVVARVTPDTKPDDPAVVQILEDDIEKK
jgi:glutathione peroxidase